MSYGTVLTNAEGMVVIVIYTGRLIDPYLCVARPVRLHGPPSRV